MQAQPAEELKPIETGPPIAWTDRKLLLILAGALVMQLVTLSRVDGYQLADSVEYMDRANMVVNGEAFDPRTPRPFTFSALLSPFFLVAKLFAFERFDSVVALVRGLQILVGLGTIVVVARIGSRLGGRNLGLVAALFMAANVAFLRYTISPVSDPESMLFMALGIESLLLPRTRKRGFLTGFYLGASILFTYKAFPIVVLILVGLFLRERMRYWAWLKVTAVGIVACISLAAALDTKVYGNFGSSIGGYFVTNMVSEVSKGIYHLGFEDAGRWVYNNFSLAEEIDEVKSAAGVFQGLESQVFYFENASAEFYPWPLLALFLLGCLSALRRFRFPGTLYLFVVASFLVMLNNKGSKSFRLALPLLPMISLLGAMGWQALRGSTTVAPGGNLLRSVFAALVLLVGVFSVPGKMLRLNLKEHGGYWHAMEIVNEEVRRERERREDAGLPVAVPVVGSAYHWAVSLRQTSDIRLVRLPMEMLAFTPRADREKYTPLVQKMLDTIESYDWFIAHMQVLWQSPEIMEVVNRTFEIHTILYDTELYGKLAPICVLRRRDAHGSTGERTFFEHFPEVPGDALTAYRASIQTPTEVLFERRAPSGAVQRIELMGFDVETGLGGGDMAWVTYHWYAHTDGIEEFGFDVRMTDADGTAGLTGRPGMLPAYGVHPTSSWKRGTVIRESYPRLLPLEPWRFGGAHRRGDLIPTTIWMKVERGGSATDRTTMSVVHPTEGRPLVSRLGRSEADRRDAFQWESDGRLWDAEGRVRVGGFWMPIPATLQVPDDGRPITIPAQLP